MLLFDGICLRRISMQRISTPETSIVANSRQNQLLSHQRNFFNIASISAHIDKADRGEERVRLPQVTRLPHMKAVCASHRSDSRRIWKISSRAIAAPRRAPGHAFQFRVGIRASLGWQVLIIALNRYYGLHHAKMYSNRSRWFERGCVSVTL